MEKIKWQDKINNDEVLTIVDENKCLMRSIGERKKNWIGHVLSGEEKELDMTCVEGRWTAERRTGGKNVREKTARQEWEE